ncbi:MAG: PEP-CTERM sorting domain-containing protein [Candidatus Korobacteraceae bacterium]
MNRKFSVLLLLVCLVSLTALGFGSSSPVILGDSGNDQITFTNMGSNSAEVAFVGSCSQNPTNCLSGYAYDGANVGTYSMWFVSGRGAGDMSLGSPTNDVYPINMDGSVIDFAVSFGSSFIDGTVDLFNVTDGTNVPRFIGGLDITSSNVPGFTNGGYSDLDFNIFLGNNPTITQVYSGQAQFTEGPISAGELQPVPEPSSIALLGSGVLGLAGVLRRKLNR